MAYKPSKVLKLGSSLNQMQFLYFIRLILYRLPNERCSTKKHDSLVKEDKIYRVFQSDWASPEVNVQKADNTYRICVSFKRTVNPQIQPEVYPIPVPEKALTSLVEGNVFVTLDLADAYTQLKIAPETAPLSTMNTHKGLFRCYRLIYGISSAAAIFQCNAQWTEFYKISRT